MLALASRTARRLAAIAFVVLLAPASALADVTVSSFTVSPSTKAAGGHPDLTVDAAFSYTGGDNLKKLVLHFPPGVIGNPQVTTKCTQSQFDSNSCPASSQVGTTTVVSTAFGVVQTTSPGTVYNLVPAGSEPARLGIIVQAAGGLGTISLTSTVTLRTATDFGIDSTTDNIPDSLNGIPITIDSLSLTLNGMAGSPPAAFMTNPTSCAPANTVVGASSYNAPAATATGSSSFTPTDCDKLPFSPRITASVGAPGATKRNSHPPLSTTITQQPGEANTSAAAVTLPTAVGANLPALKVLCSSDQLATGACPADSQVGQAKILSPLLPAPLSGPVYATVPTTGLPGLALVLGGPLTFTLNASVAFTHSQIQNTLSGLPDVPLSSFQLMVNGGPRGLLNAGDLCSGAVPTIAGAFTAQSGATANVSSPVTVVGCDPAATASGRGFRGAHPRLALKVVQGPGASVPIKRVTMTLPRDIRAARRVSSGTSVRVASALPRGDFRLSRKGTFTVSIPAGGAHRIHATLGRGAIASSAHLKRTLKRHRSATLQLKLKIVDANGHSTTLTVPVRAAR